MLLQRTRLIIPLMLHASQTARCPDPVRASQILRMSSSRMEFVILSFTVHRRLKPRSRTQRWSM